MWGLFGERPHGENQKNLKNLEKTKKNNIWGLLAGPPYPPRPLENCFFFVFFFLFSSSFWFSNFLIPKTSGKLYFSFPWHMSILAGICDIWVICSIFASLFDLPAHLAKPIASLAPAPELSATQRQSCFTYFASSVYPL